MPFTLDGYAALHRAVSEMRADDLLPRGSNVALFDVSR